MKKTIFLLILLGLAAVSSYAGDFVPALDINGGLTYPTILTNESSDLARKLGGDAGLAGSFMVNTDWLPQLWFIPTLTSNYSSTAQPLNVDDQKFLFSQWLDVYFSAGFNYQFSDKWEARARALWRNDYASQTADEQLGKGLYDYIDRGFYLENANKVELGAPMEITLGFKYIDMRFPNYQSLISMVNPDTIGGTLNAAAKNEKDNLTYSFYLVDTVQIGDSGWIPEISFTYDYTPYFDQYIIEPDGTLGNKKRIDRIATLSLDFPYYAGKVSGMDLGYILNVKTTDQNYYDTLGDLDPSNDEYLLNYYNYIENTIKLQLTYELDVKIFNDYKPAIVIGLTYDILAYTQRFAKYANGMYDYTDSNGKYYPRVKQLDNSYTLSIDFKQKIMDFWNYYLDATYSRYFSNMEWDAYGTYNYTYLTVSLGTALSF
jgi:hypothetical protein